MKRLKIISLLGAVVVLNSCGLYKQYQRPSVNTKGLYRDSISLNDTLATADTLNMGNLKWQEVFTDAALQQLIDSGLKNNANLQVAILSVQEAEAQLRAAKVSFFSSFAFNGIGAVGRWDFSTTATTYSLPIAASWNIDLFGKLTNAKRAQQAILLQSKAYQQAVRTSLVSNIANSYYTLLMLDRQLEITDSTAVLTKHTWDIMVAQKNYSSSTNEASVQSAKANYYSVLSSAEELKRQIRTTENALSLLINQSPQTIRRNKIEDQTLPENLAVGVPVQLLSNRPDVYSAELNLAACYYQKKQAQANFYPNLTLSGSAGWTNSASIVINPGKVLLSAVANLTQPIFENGKLKASLKVAEAQQQTAYIKWQYAVLSAGSEVNNALALYQTSAKKGSFDQQRVESLIKNVDYAQKMFSLSPSVTYLEIITAQQALLTAQLSKVTDDFNKMQSIVNLYYALGGGR